MPNSSTQESHQRAAKLIQSADALIIAAGAGMGVDSGLPDFRGNQGFWQAYPALARLDFTEVANPRAFVEDARLAWGFYGHRLGLYRSTGATSGFCDSCAVGSRSAIGALGFYQQRRWPISKGWVSGKQST